MDSQRSPSEINSKERVYRNGREWMTCDDGTQWTRRIDSARNPIAEWSQVELPPKEQHHPTKYQLRVVMLSQAAGEPLHWALFCYKPDQNELGPGRVWQVTGDAEFMHYQHIPSDDILRAESYYESYVMAKDLTSDQMNLIEAIANEEPPPQARSRAEVKENCQGWCIRVLDRVVKEGLADARAVEPLRSMLEPVRTTAS